MDRVYTGFCKTRFKPGLDLVQTWYKCNFHMIKFEKGEFLGGGGGEIMNQIMVEHRRGYICNVRYNMLVDYMYESD